MISEKNGNISRKLFRYQRTNSGGGFLWKSINAVCLRLSIKHIMLTLQFPCVPVNAIEIIATTKFNWAHILCNTRHLSAYIVYWCLYFIWCQSALFLISRLFRSNILIEYSIMITNSSGLNKQIYKWGSKIPVSRCGEESNGRKMISK